MIPAIVLAAMYLPGATASAAPGEQDDSWHLCVGSGAGTAIAACTAIIRARGGNLALAYYNRGIAHRLTRQFGRALADLNRSIRLQPDFAAAYVERGIVWFEKHDYARAIADDDAAIRLKPELAEPFNNRSLAWLKLARYDLATADFNQTIRLHQNYGNALINRSLGPLVPPVR